MLENALPNDLAFTEELDPEVLPGPLGPEDDILSWVSFKLWIRCRLGRQNRNTTNAVKKRVSVSSGTSKKSRVSVYPNNQ